MKNERLVLRGDPDGELPAEPELPKSDPGVATLIFRTTLAVTILMPLLASSIWLTAWIISNLPTR